MITELKPHHKKAIENLISEYQHDERFLAVIIGGSVAKKLAREDSDVDFMIVANDEEFTKRNSIGDLFINRTDLCDYPNGFVDGKIIDMKYLNNVAEKGNEPSRAAFDGAFIAYSRLENLEDIIKKISTYPENRRDERLKSFYAMAFIQNWLMGEANRHGNIYTKTRAASQLALYAGRLILTYNRILFPYHKWFMQYIERCPEKPVNFIDQIQNLLKEPNAQNSNMLFQNLKDFRDWNVSDLEAYDWFMKQVEWSWMNNNTPLEDL